MEDRKLVQFYKRLTPRQQEVVEWVSLGLTNTQVAEQLVIEPCVVAAHLSIVYAELGTQEEYAHRHPNRYVLVALFADFFKRHPDLSTRDSVQD